MNKVVAFNSTKMAKIPYSHLFTHNSHFLHQVNYRYLTFLDLQSSRNFTDEDIEKEKLDKLHKYELYLK